MAAHLVDFRIPLVPTRQFVVTFPVQIRLWLAKSKPLAAWVCAKVAQCLQSNLRSESGIEGGKTGFVSFVQRFGAVPRDAFFRKPLLDDFYDMIDGLCLELLKDRQLSPNRELTEFHRQRPALNLEDMKAIFEKWKPIVSA